MFGKRFEIYDFDSKKYFRTWEAFARLDNSVAVIIADTRDKIISRNASDTAIGWISIEQPNTNRSCTSCTISITSSEPQKVWAWLVANSYPGELLEVWGIWEGRRRRFYTNLNYATIPEHFRVLPSVTLLERPGYKNKGFTGVALDIDEGCAAAGVITLGEVCMQTPDVLRGLGINKDCDVLEMLVSNFEAWGLRFGMSVTELEKHPGVMQMKPKLPESCADQNTLRSLIESLNALGLFTEAQNIERLVSQGRVAEAWEAADKIIQIMRGFQSALAKEFTER